MLVVNLPILPFAQSATVAPFASGADHQVRSAISSLTSPNPTVGYEPWSAKIFPADFVRWEAESDEG